MKGIYLTEQGKQEIEAKIAELEELSNPSKQGNENFITKCEGQIELYKEILSSATILPIAAWEDTYQTALTDDLNREEYPNGVIII